MAALLTLVACQGQDLSVGQVQHTGTDSGTRTEIDSGEGQPSGQQPSSGLGGNGSGNAVANTGGAVGNQSPATPGAEGAQPAQPGPAPAAGAAPAGGTAKTRKSITFTGSKGDQVPGYIWLPAMQPGQKFPASIIMYGIGGDKDDSGIAQAADVLSDDGIISMTLDWPGTGGRQPTIGNEERVTSTSVLDWTVADYRAALTFLASQPEVDSSRLAYVGASMGAMTGLAFVSGESRIKTMVAVVPIPNPLWLGNDPEVTIGRVAPRPTLCIATQSNVDFSQVVCRNVKSPGRMQTFDAGHELQNIRPEVADAIKTYLDQNLK